jgi:hypothetical protein
MAPGKIVSGAIFFGACRCQPVFPSLLFTGSFGLQCRAARFRLDFFRGIVLIKFR